MNFKVNFGVKMTKDIDSCKEYCMKITKIFEDKIAKDLGLENDMTIFFFGVTENFTTIQRQKIMQKYGKLI